MRLTATLAILSAFALTLAGCGSWGQTQQAGVALASDVQTAAEQAAAAAAAKGDAKGEAKANAIVQGAKEVGAFIADPVAGVANLALKHEVGAYSLIGLALAAKYLPGLFGVLGLQPKPAAPKPPTP